MSLTLGGLPVFPMLSADPVPDGVVCNSLRDTKSRFRSLSVYIKAFLLAGHQSRYIILLTAGRYLTNFPINYYAYVCKCFLLYGTHCRCGLIRFYEHF